MTGSPRAPDRIELRGGASLRVLTPDDAPLVFATVDRERGRLRQWLAWVDRSLAATDTRSLIEATLATEGREYLYGIWATDGFAGAIGLHTDPQHRSAEIGYWIDAAHEGQGLITRSAHALANVAFETLGMHRVWIAADPRNRRSCAVAERLGFILEGVRREDTFTDGSFGDTAIYAILDREWRSRTP